MKIAILDSESRKALALTRAFGKNNCDVINISLYRQNISKYSKFSFKGIYLKNYNLLNEILKNENVDIIIPCEEKSTGFLIENKNLFKNFFTILPLKKSFEITLDKGKTMIYANNLGLRIPKTFQFNRIEEMNLFFRNLKENEYPFIIKPKISSGSRGIKKVRNFKDYLNNIDKILKFYGMPIIQEYIPKEGKAIGASYLFSNGKEMMHSIHERIREYPVNGGPSTYCRSVFNKEAYTIGKNILEKLKWNGFAMVEFKEDIRTKELILLEINPRPWGTIALPLKSGNDYTKKIIEIYNGNLKNHKNVYKKSYLRWYFPSDIMSILQSKISIKNKIIKIFKIERSKNHFMIYEKGDVRPLLYYFFFTITSIFNLKKIKRNIFR